MCRVMIYLGTENIEPYLFLYAPDNSIVKQSYSPKLMTHILNLAGFGMCAWEYGSHIPKKPFVYKTTDLPFYDSNLLNLSKKIRVNCMISHVRGVSYSVDEVISNQNVHPFIFDNYKIALAHNGSLADMDLLKSSLVRYLSPDVFKHLSGTTDSEWVYAVFCSQLHDPTKEVSLEEAREALVKTLKIIRDERRKLGIFKSSPLNLFISNGNYVLVSRFAYNFGCEIEGVEEAFVEYRSLWFTYGDHYSYEDSTYEIVGSSKKKDIILASEPLTRDRTKWGELPEYSLTSAWLDRDEIRIQIDDLDV